MIMKDKLLYLINHYGKKKQVDIAIEEMSELTKSLLKERRLYYESNISFDERYKKQEKYQNDVREEIADVMVMIEQLKIIFNLKNEEIERRMLEKIDRQIERISKGVK